VSAVIRTDIADGIALVVLDRPKALNALDGAMVEALAETMPRLERDPAARVVVIEGAGDHFMAGGDLKYFDREMSGDGTARAIAFEEFINRVHPAIVSMRRMPKPIIAKVRGAAAGFGLSLVLATDLTIAAEDAYFTTAYCRLGTSPDGGSTWALPRLVGIKKAMELALLGDRFDAATAMTYGVVNRVVAADDLDDTVAEIAARLAAGPARAFAHTKRLLYASLQNDLPSQLAAEAESFADCAAHPDFAEGLAAFIAKRTPEFGQG